MEQPVEVTNQRLWTGMNLKIGKRTTNIFFEATDGEFVMYYGNKKLNSEVHRLQYNWSGCFSSVFSCAYHRILRTDYRLIFFCRYPQWNEYRQKFTHDILRNYWHSNIQPIVNIHTHLWGAVLFSYFLATFYPTYLQLHGITTWRDSAVIGIFLSSATFCLAASSFYHMSCCHSQKVWH